MNRRLALAEAKARVFEFEEQGCRIAWSLLGEGTDKKDLYDTSEDAISHAKRSSIFVHVYYHVAETLNLGHFITDHIEHDFSDILRTHYSDYGDSASLDLPPKIGVALEELQGKLNSIVRELDIYHTCLCFEVDISPWNSPTVSTLVRGDQVVIEGEVFQFIVHSNCGSFGAFWVDGYSDTRAFPSETPVTRYEIP